jgi:hypothetical protein
MFFVTKAYKLVKSESTFFLKAAFITIFVCLLCEVFVFNARHFVTHWGDDQIDMSSSECRIINMVYNNQYGLFVATGEGIPEIVFPNINKRVVTVYIDAVFSDGRSMQSFQINYGSEEHSNRTTSAFYVINGVEESKYVTLHTSGKVSHIGLMFGDQNLMSVAIRGVTLNKPVPLKLFWSRVLLFSIIAFCIVVIKHKKLFPLPVRSDSKGQKILTAGIMIAYITFIFAVMLFTRSFSLKRPFKDNFEYVNKDQYNAFVVDAILDGHAYLNIEPTKELLSLKNPYDPQEWRSVNTNLPSSDYVYYKGKFYSYFGIVQVLVLALPYKLITGRYIPTKVAVFIFSALASIFLMLIWRRMVFRYMRKMPLGMYALGQLTVAMGSMLSFLTYHPTVYPVANSSALFFATSGFYIILGESERKKTRYTEIAVGSLCMALAVGCRPTYMLFLLLIPVILFEKMKKLWKDKKRFIGMCVCIVAPITLVAFGLMWYNYIRYGSVFEFGTNYLLSGHNIKARNSINPVGRLTEILVGFFYFMVPSFDISASFPFIVLKKIEINRVFKAFIYNGGAMGLIAFPVTWFISGIGTVKKVIDKRRKSIFHLMIAMISLGFLQIPLIMLTVSAVTVRYCVDFFWLFVLSGLFCAYFIYEGMTKCQECIIQTQHQITLNLYEMASRVINTFMIISILLMFLLTLGGDPAYGDSYIWVNNPSVYYKIQRLLGFNTW